MPPTAHLAAAEEISVADIRKSLQERIARITGQEGLPSPRQSAPWHFGIAEIDDHLPKTGLASNRLHEIAPACAPDMPAAIGFAVSLAVRRSLTHQAPILWLSANRRMGEFGRPYGHGFKSLGLARQKWLTARLHKPADMLWALEQALRAKALSLIIADAPALAADLSLSRRLSLAAAEGGTPAILLCEHGFTGATATASRWQVKSIPSQPPQYDPLSPGAPSWALSLTRCRSGKPGEWHVEWHHATHHFHLVSRLQPQSARDPMPETEARFSRQARPALRVS